MGALIFIILLAIVAIVIFVVLDDRKKIKERRVVLEEKIKKIDNFEVTERIEAGDLSYALLFDDNQKKMVFARNSYLGIINYYEIINVEISIDNAIVSSRSTSKTIGRAVAGGLLLGGVGAIVGGMTAGNKNTQYVSNIFVTIETTNRNKSVFNIEVFNAVAMCGTNEVKPFTFKWDIYQNCLKLARRIEYKLGQIIEDNSLGINEVTPNSTSSADEILKLHNLLKEGIITQEEFELEKAKILGRE